MLQLPLGAIDPLAYMLAVAAVLGPLLTYVVSARRFGGEVGSSEAKDLWAESRSIRDWSATRIDALERENKDLREGRMQDRERIALLEAKLEQITGENAPDWLS
jgi:hypothetical protein